MKYTLIGELPKHIYCYVDSYYTHKKYEGMNKAVWFGLVSHPGRMWGCNVMLECGAVYRNVPVHAIAFSAKPDDTWYPWQAQTWDCYGTDFSTLEYSYLSGLGCMAMLSNNQSRNATTGVRTGTYLFTAAPVGDAFSEAPDQAKEFTFVKLDNDRLTVQPTDRILFWDYSFTNSSEPLPNLRRQKETYSVEQDPWDKKANSPAAKAERRKFQMESKKPWKEKKTQEKEKKNQKPASTT